MSGLHLDGQVEASFDTFATASDQLDIDRLAELLAAVGITRMVLVGLRHHALDDVDALARTDWRGERPAASSRVRLSSRFILRRDGDRLRVVFYLNHQDLTRALGVT
jgi:hypothetical protein